MRTTYAPQRPPPPPPPEQSGFLMRALRYVGGKAKTGMAVVGVVATAAFYLNQKASAPHPDDDKKKVLCIPFHRIILSDTFENVPATLSDLSDLDRPMKLSTRELVEIIHAAAEDPNVVALYGKFGNGSLLPDAGWADLEEVRQALKVFKQAHRSHPEPNMAHDLQYTVNRTAPKALIAYADNFEGTGGNKDYFLASIFTHIHMQNLGHLNLFGMSSTSIFLKDFLRKYGVKVDVFKHGPYKTAPNMFTENKYTFEHRRNMTALMNSLQEDVNDDITISRSKSLAGKWMLKKHEGVDAMWKRIFNAGTFNAASAYERGFVDFLQPRDPCNDFFKLERTVEKAKAETEATEDSVQEVHNFIHNKRVDLKEYKSILDRKKRTTLKNTFVQRRLRDAVQKVPWLEEYIGKSDELVSAEKIGLIYINGGIDDEQAHRTSKLIDQAKKDPAIKALVIRVNCPGGSVAASESIMQELAGCAKPVIVSFGNVAASGGYYISSKSDRIFASHKTITGSIGVYSLRFDITGLAKQYGINAQHISMGDYSNIHSSLQPLTPKMAKNFQQNAESIYHYFKELVSSGRSLSMTEVEALAQGRVFTGFEAKMNGLVDELGGLQRAIAFAQRTYCEQEAQVVHLKYQPWYVKLFGEMSAASILISTIVTEKESPMKRSNMFKAIASGRAGTLSGTYLTLDENSAVRSLLGLPMIEDYTKTNPLPEFFWD
jgi:protease-4